MFKEFKEFALKGNVIDLAIGVIVGGGVGNVVDAMVGDLIMHVVSMRIGHLDFSYYFIALAHVPEQVRLTLDALKEAGIHVFAYGNFITVAVNFLILAFVIFLMVKQINSLKRSETAAPAAAEVVTPEDILLLREIRDQLKR